MIVIILKLLKTGETMKKQLFVLGLIVMSNAVQAAEKVRKFKFTTNGVVEIIKEGVIDEDKIISILQEQKNKLSEKDFKKIISSQSSKDYDYHTPLTAALNEKKLDVAIWLIESGVNVNVPNKSTGQTPLMLAVSTLGRSDKALIIRDMLISFGADETIKDKTTKQVVDEKRKTKEIKGRTVFDYLTEEEADVLREKIRYFRGE
jgi:hypothetical protein